MKNTYQNPVITITDLQADEEMLATSVLNVSKDDYNSGTILSRRNGQWEKDDEEEE